MEFDRTRALALLQEGTVLPTASFRAGQEEAIRYVVEGNRRLLLVQRTGWGKSFVYFIAARMLRDAGLGPTLLISPLLALMRNQLRAAERMGVRARTLHSGNRDRWPEVEQAVRENVVDVLLVSPERLANQRFQERVLDPLGGAISMLVVDEAHCISDWGHDFRPHYRLIERILRLLPRNVRLLATTATANDRVVQDLVTFLGPELEVSRGSLYRSSLKLQTIRLPGQAERLAWLARYLPRLPGSGIIYTLTVGDAERVARWLQARHYDVESYTGRTGDRRPELENKLLENRLKALVATTALGMGFDKPDLGFVVHFQAPGSVIHYYQQVGRAGRALPEAYGILLGGEEDTQITDWFIDSAFPTRDEVARVLAALEEAPDGLTLDQLLGHVNIQRSRMKHALLLLSLESPAPVIQEDGRWLLTATPLGNDFWDRADRLQELRKREQQEMQEYVRLERGHMAYLLRALDSDEPIPASPSPARFPAAVPEELVAEAIGFLRHSFPSIQLRDRWPKTCLPGFGVSSGPIPREHQAEEGRALSVYGDAGWGQMVAQGKYTEGRFPDVLVSACRVMLEDWAPDPPPTWVTCIPSLRHPDLVPDFSRRLAAALDLPFVASLAWKEERPEQKTFQNSVQQALNLDGALEVTGNPLPRGPVLLVDDIVDSRWTLTFAAWLLRRHGSGPVWPMVLARAGRGS